MSEDLEEIKERQEQLEQYVSLLEARVDVQESLMKLYAAGREPAALPGADDPLTADQNAGRAPTGAEDPNLKGFDFLLRSILTQQGMHNTDIRKSVRDQKRLQSSIDRVIGTLRSIEETMRTWMPTSRMTVPASIVRAKAKAGPIPKGTSWLTILRTLVNGAAPSRVGWVR